ncbi:hypothetical protein [Paraburkholderia hospita]|nr:hypothetical protein [Paraburkholderia hospita]
MAMLADAVHDVAAASARLKGSVGHQERRRRVFAKEGLNNPFFALDF